MSLTSYQPRSVLITGGAGFIGANFIHYLLANDAKVKIINLDLLTYAGSLENLIHLPDSSRYTFVHGDICDRQLISELLHDQVIDTIVHFAAESHVDRSILSPEQFIQTNVVGTFSLLEAARQYWVQEKHWNDTQCRFHHISTDEVYGSLLRDEPAFTECSPYAPNSPYSASKAASDHIARSYFQTYHLPLTISHCSNNYGPRQHPEKFIPTIIRQCRDWQPIPIYGDGTHIRDWLYVEDHCIGIDLILRHGKIGETYDLGANQEMNNLCVAQYICDVMNKHFPRKRSYRRLIEHVPDRPGHDWRYALSAFKMTEQLHWKPRESFENGIQKTIKFYCR